MYRSSDRKERKGMISFVIYKESYISSGEERKQILLSPSVFVAASLNFEFKKRKVFLPLTIGYMIFVIGVGGCSIA